jgi:outer membrane protein
MFSKTHYIFLLLCSIVVIQTYAQEASPSASHITLDEAIEAALQQNFDIRISQTELEQAKANNTIGNAGMLPEVALQGGLNGSVNDTRLELASGQIQDRKGATSRGVSGAVLLNWTLFDGMQMFINKERLEQLERSSTIALKQQVQSTVANVINAYAGVVLQKQQVTAIDTAMALANARLEIARRSFEIGSTAKTDFLQAQVDFNASKAARLTQLALLRQAKDSLLIIMGRDLFEDFDVADSLVLNMQLTFKDKHDWISNNFSHQLARQNKLLAEYNERLARAAQLPRVDLTGAYNYNRTISGAGFALFNRAFGPQAGLTLTLPLFNGFNAQRQKKVAQQEVFRQDLIIAQIENSLAARYRTAWRTYDNAIKAYELEKLNITYAQENVMIQQARFRVGVANTLELREAENSYVAALTRLSEAAYNVKTAEIRLLELENNLVK